MRIAVGGIPTSGVVLSLQDLISSIEAAVQDVSRRDTVLCCSGNGNIAVGTADAYTGDTDSLCHHACILLCQLCAQFFPRCPVAGLSARVIAREVDLSLFLYGTSDEVELR